MVTEKEINAALNYASGVIPLLRVGCGQSPTRPSRQEPLRLKWVRTNQVHVALSADYVCTMQHLFGLTKLCLEVDYFWVSVLERGAPAMSEAPRGGGSQRPPGALCPVLL